MSCLTSSVAGAFLALPLATRLTEAALTRTSVSGPEMSGPVSVVQVRRRSIWAKVGWLAQVVEIVVYRPTRHWTNELAQGSEGLPVKGEACQARRVLETDA